MNNTGSQWLILTPAGVLQVFARKEPDDAELALQGLLAGERTLDAVDWGWEICTCPNGHELSHSTRVGASSTTPATGTGCQVG